MSEVGIIGTLKAERQRLLEELKTHPVYRRYRLIGQLINEYGGKSSETLFEGEAAPAAVAAMSAAVPLDTEGPPITMVRAGVSGLTRRAKQAERAAEREAKRVAHLAETGQELPPASKRTRALNPDSLSAKIVEAAVEYLTKRGQRATSGEILRGLERIGMKFEGERPSTKVSAALTQSTLFNNRRPKGYGLVAWAEDVVIKPIYPETQLQGQAAEAAISTESARDQAA